MGSGGLSPGRAPASLLLTGVSEALPASPLLTRDSGAVFCNSLLTPVSAVLWQGGAGGVGYAEDSPAVSGASGKASANLRASVRRSAAS